MLSVNYIDEFQRSSIMVNETSSPKKNQLLQINGLQRRKVIEHNDLISSVAKMDKVPLKIFELAVSCINTANPPKDNIVYLSKKELFLFFDVADSNKHSRFKQAVEKMQKQAYFEVRESTGNGFEFESIVPIPYIKWNDYNDEVTIRFDIAIMPYLIELKSNFTQYAISDIMELKSKYSIIIYKWLCMFYNQYEHYQNTGNRRQLQLDEYKNPTITVNDLRQLTDTITEYKRFNDFSRYVIDNALQDINKHTHFHVTYEKIKKGRSIDRIQFHIKKKFIAPNINYKDEQNDEIYLDLKEKKEQTQQKLFTEAMQSPYTTILGANMLIGFKDTQNIIFMSSLQQIVYPLYDELKQLRGQKGVKEHINYIAQKQEGYSKKNVVKYLKTSIERYLVTVKRQDLIDE